MDASFLALTTFGAEDCLTHAVIPHPPKTGNGRNWNRKLYSFIVDIEIVGCIWQKPVLTYASIVFIADVGEFCEFRVSVRLIGVVAGGIWHAAASGIFGTLVVYWASWVYTVLM